MRDFRDAKAMAQTLRAALAAKGVKITIGESLELIAKALGAADWNTLSAAIKTAEAKPAAETAVEAPDNKAALNLLATGLGWSDWETLLAALRTIRPRTQAPSESGAPPLKPPTRSGGTRFTSDLEATLHRAVALAAERKHRYTTLEHLLLALIDDPDAGAVMEACRVDLASLRATTTRYIDEELKTLTRMGEGDGENEPTAGFHRVVQRSVIHMQSAGKGEVTGANLLVAIFSERESHAAYFLGQQKMNRYDAVNFIANGIRKGGAAA